MDIPVVIPCYIQNEESYQIEKMRDDMGIETDVDMDTVYDISSVYFYHISYILEHPNGKDTMIGSGGGDFRTPICIKEVLKLLK